MLGKKPRKSHLPQDDKALEKGDMCLLNVPRWSRHWPQVGQVLGIKEETVTIKWYKGGLTGKQEPEVLHQKGVGKIDWIEDVHASTIWLHGFQLTKGSRLPKEVAQKIEEYERD